MANIFNFLNNVFLEIKQENRTNRSFVYFILLLLTIQLSLAINNICLGLLFISTIVYFKKYNFKLDYNLFLPISLYLLMVVSVFWSIDIENTKTALLKELPILIIPVCFLFFQELTKETKQIIIKYYSYGIVLFSFFYLLKAIIRFYFSQNLDVFFYHELVTKEVNAIHVSVYVAIAFFYFFIKPIKSVFDYVAVFVLFLMVFLLSSKNIIVVFIGLIIVYQLFYAKSAKKLRLKNLVVFTVLLCSLFFIGKIKARFREEYETIMTDSTVNDVVSKGKGTIYNVSIKQAWTNNTFQPNDYFPGTAFRVYQFRIFLEMLQEDGIFWKGYGLNASYPKIAEKGVFYNVFLGTDEQQGYQTKNFHNQYVQNFAELGIFGFLILIIMLFINLRNGINNKNFLHIAFAILMISLFLTETFLWRQRGVVFFTTMYCLFNSGIYKNKKGE
jgi:O-antigen ligase